MIRRDYLLRMIQQLVEALARVAYLRINGRHEQAAEEIGQTLAAVFGMEAGRVGQLSVHELVALCQGAGGPPTETWIKLADLLKQQSDLFALHNKPAECRASQMQALGLYLEAFTGPSGMVSLDALAKVESLIEQGGNRPWPREIIPRLLRYFELRGQYGRAEDLLFAWLEAGESEAATEGLKFYERLAAKPDGELAQGNLARPEVEEGRKAFLSRTCPGHPKGMSR